MKTDLPFLELEHAKRIAIRFDGETLDLPEGANLAAALLVAGVEVFRQSPVSGAPRAPHCMMGVCFECLVEIDGVARQACMLEVTDGMEVTRVRPAEAIDEPK